MSGRVNSIQCPFGPDWKVIREIGHGSYGSVYLIEREIGNETIQSAMKVIRLPASEDEPEQIISRTGKSLEEVKAYYQSLGDALLPEIQLMSKLRGDSHIVSYEDHAVVQHDSGIGLDIFIRMEYLESLPHWLNGRSLTNGDIVQLGLQLCEGLETCAHSKIVHRDIKPANIFVAANGAFKLGDFGIAQKLDSYMDAEDRKLGSLNYIAPEVKRGDAFDERVDIYGLGMVMYRILNDGRIPFLPEAPQAYTDEQEERARERRLNGEKLTKPAHCCDVLWAVIEKACAYHPEGRYQDATEMRKALRAISTHSEMAQALPVSNKRRKDSDTSPRTRSTGPNGTELRKRGTETPTPPPMQEEPKREEQEEHKKQDIVVSDHNKKLIIRIVVAAAVLIIAVVAFFLFRKNNVNVQHELKASLELANEETVQLQVSEGKQPYKVSIINGEYIVDTYEFDNQGVELTNLTPGSEYRLQIVDSDNGYTDLAVTMPGGKTYTGSDQYSMIVYECDRQALASSDWLTLSSKNRVQKISEEGIILRNAPAAAQSKQWYALVHAKSNGSSSDTVDGILTLRLANNVVVSQQVQVLVASDSYVQTPLNLDPLLDKVWKACGQWLTGEARLELYIQGQFVTDGELKISTDMKIKDGED